MIRNLKVLVVAAMALASLGAVAASAHAAEEFHCSSGPCRIRGANDGTGKTGHQVFIVKDSEGHEASFTCNTVTAEATTEGKTATSAKFTNIIYGENNSANCTVNGSAGVTVVTTGCSYEFKAAGGATSAGVNVACGSTPIEIRIPNCTFTISTQSLTGAKYHNIGVEASNTTELTVENHITGISTSIAAGGTLANCHVNPAKTLTSEYSTGNVLATGETDVASPVMGNVWWA